jgi:hypothetical protein
MMYQPATTRAALLPSLEKALAIYGAGKGGKNPVKDKAKLVADLRKAVDALISPDPLRREFLGHVRIVNTLHGAVEHDPAAVEFAGRLAALTAIVDAIRTTMNPIRRTSRKSWATSAGCSIHRLLAWTCLPNSRLELSGLLHLWVLGEHHGSAFQPQDSLVRIPRHSCAKDAEIDTTSKARESGSKIEP